MAKDFEDMNWQEWPAELTELHTAAQAAWEAYAALDEILSTHPRTVLNHDVTRSTLTELAGRAYALLRDLRAEGMRQLAAWEESQMEQQLVKLAENEIEWEEGQDTEEEETCAACDGKGYERIGPLNLNCAACEGTGLIARKGNASPEN